MRYISGVGDMDQEDQFREFLIGARARLMMRRALQKMIREDPEMKSLLKRIRIECNRRGLNILFGIVMTFGSFLSLFLSANEKNSVFSELLGSW